MISALRSAGATLADIAGVRAALAVVELREEIERRRQQIVLAAVAFVFAYSGILIATLFVAALFWDTHRLAALAVLALAHLACAGAAIAVIRRRALAAPAPFAATRRELALDFAAWGAP